MARKYTDEELDEMFSMENLLQTAKLEREKKAALRKMQEILAKKP